MKEWKGAFGRLEVGVEIRVRYSQVGAIIGQLMKFRDTLFSASFLYGICSSLFPCC